MLCDVALVSNTSTHTSIIHIYANFMYRPCADSLEVPKTITKMQQFSLSVSVFYGMMTDESLRWFQCSLSHVVLCRNLVVLPLALMMVHLAIGDTWNTINNVERRMGTAVAGVALVWLSVIAVDSAYFNTTTTAGLLLAPSVVWLSVASFLVYTINQLNGPEPLFPVKKDS